MSEPVVVEKPDVVIHRCRPHVTDANRARLLDYHTNRQKAAKASTADTSSTITVYVNYVVIPMSSDDIVSSSQIQAQHDMINLHYGSYQKVAGTSNSAHYPYFDLDTIMGDPHIAFVQASAPQTLSIPSPAITNGGFATPTDAETYFVSKGGQVISGVVYIYITKIVDPAVSGTILGMARDIIANALMIDPGTVGSTSSLGTYGASYGEGKTLIHELGHCFGLLHTFSDIGSCTDEVAIAANPQSPPQKNPNFYTTLSPPDGTPADNFLDNRGRDEMRFCTSDPSCMSSTSNGLNPGDSNPSVDAYSCATREQLTSSSLPYETFMAFMDYSNDDASLGFPTSAVSTMRSVIQDHTTLFDTSATVPTAVASIPIPTASPSASSFPTWAIAVVCIVGSLIIIAIVAGVVAKTTAGKSSVSQKSIHAYQTPFLMRKYV